jgi:hypothetical protein
MAVIFTIPVSGAAKDLRFVSHAAAGSANAAFIKSLRLKSVISPHIYGSLLAGQ